PAAGHPGRLADADLLTSGLLTSGLLTSGLLTSGLLTAGRPPAALPTAPLSRGTPRRRAAMRTGRSIRWSGERDSRAAHPGVDQAGRGGPQPHRPDPGPGAGQGLPDRGARPAPGRRRAARPALRRARRQAVLPSA